MTAGDDNMTTATGIAGGAAAPGAGGMAPAMRLDEHTDFSTLGWVKPQIDQLLNESRQALETFAENPDDTLAMRTCAGLLHQVLGTLRMVELYGAAELAQAMELLARALLEGKVGDRDEAASALMRALVQLPDYLDLIEIGHKDVPIVLLPLLNELLAARGAEPANERVLFHPDLGRSLPSAAAGARAPFPFADLRQRGTKLRASFQVQLLAWAQGKPPNFADMVKAADGLRELCHAEAARRLWWVAGGVLEALQQGRLDFHVASLRQQFGHLDRVIRRLLDQGEDACADDDARELLRVLLYTVAQTKPGAGRSEVIAACFGLREMVPSEAELEHARAAMSGRNRTLLDTVAKAVREDLLRVKEGLDIFLRRDDRQPQQLLAQVEVLQRVADTLDMLGLDAPARMIDGQRAAVTEIIDGKREASSMAVLDIASALLHVDASLDQHIDNLGVGGVSSDVDALPPSEARKITRAVMHEAGANLAKVKDALSGFIESAWSHRKLAALPRLLREVSGALRMLDLERPASLVDGIERFIWNELIAERRVPTVEEMDTLADSLAGVEYYLEIGRDASASDSRVLDGAQRSLVALHCWPLPERRVALEPLEEEAPESAAVDAIAALDLEEAVTIPFASDAPPPAEPGVGPGHWAEVEEEVLEAVAGQAPLVDAGFHDAVGIDEDIRKVFVDEVAEEIAGIRSNLPAWKTDPENLDALKSVRRAFHTLKGSGRLVGAATLGEFSWKVESMLNRVLDGSIQPDRNVQAVVEAAVATLPKLHAGLQGREVASLDPPLDAITQAADKLAAGEPARISDFLQGYRKVTRTVRRWMPQAGGAPTPPAKAKSGAPETHAPLAFESAADAGLAPLEFATSKVADPAPLGFKAPAKTDLAPLDFETSADAGRAPLEFEPAAPAAAVSSAALGRDAAAPAPAPPRAPRLVPSLPPIDAMLLDVLRTEVAQYLGTLRDYLSRNARFDVAVGDAVERAVHTLHGAIAMVGVESLAGLLSPLEAWVHRVRGAGAPLDREGCDALRDTVALTEYVMAQFDVPVPDLPDTTALAERLAALRDSWPEVVPVRGGDERGPTGGAYRGEVDDARREGNAAEVERRAAEQIERDRLATEQAEYDRYMAELAEQDRRAAAHAEHDRQHAEQRRRAEAEAAPRPAAANRAPAAPALPAFPDDPQPDGPLDAAIDPDLVTLFTEEGSELLDTSDALLTALRGAPAGRDSVHGLQRNLHTLKGGARVVGLAALGDLAHAMETLLEKIGDGHRAVLPIELASLERGFDRLNEMLRRVEAGRAVARPVLAIQRFDDLAEGRPIAGAPAPATAQSRPVAPAPPVAASPAARSAPVTPVPAAAPAAPPRPAPGKSAPLAMPADTHDARAAAELIRVRSDLLDSLVNAAGEASIYRARVEQQIGMFRFNLVELNQTVARLREQLRKLEIETETQILSRYQREGDAAGEQTFDPLELDRFSNLQQYSRALAESVSDLASIEDILDDQARQSETLLLQQSRVNSDLQDGLMRTRMVPFDSLVPNLRRTLRRAADELGKRAQLQVQGAQGEMDRNVLERMKAPFEHMLRNALSHGIETPAVRTAAGKPAEGTVTIQVGRQGTDVLVRVSDDGAGFDRDAIRAKAIQRGLLRSDEKVDDNELLGFVMQAGFSTAGEVSQLAGRGVGMDVVANEIRQLGGSLAIESDPGQGTVFNIRLPFTLAVTQAITVRTGEATFAIPITSIEAMSRMRRQELRVRMTADDRRVTYAGERYELHELSALLGMADSTAPEDDAAQVPLLMVRSGDLRAAVIVDVVMGSREIVVKPAGPQVNNVPGIFGATILGDGSVMLILDLAPLVRHVVAKRAAEQARRGRGAEVDLPIAQVAAVLNASLIMMVDDSITMRKVTTRVLERERMEVVTAKDGVDALEKLQDRVPDVMLLDIEMPRMDGYELATHMKNDARFRHVPIIMITSRTGEKHRRRAFEIGVDRYLGKPYSEADLLRNIAEVLGARGG